MYDIFNFISIIALVLTNMSYLKIKVSLVLVNKYKDRINEFYQPKKKARIKF